MNEEKLKEIANPNKVCRARMFLQQGRKDKIYGDNEYYRKGFLDGGLYADEHPKNPWISIKERLPKTGDDIIYLMNSGTPGRQDHYTKWFEEWLMMNTTHWMPTQTPKGGEV